MTLDLTVAIPAHNDGDALARLLARLQGLEIARHVIVVDDASDTPLEAARLSAASGGDPSALTVLRLSENKGAGAARNLALAGVTTEHLLFLDADDLPTRDLHGLCRDLAGRTFDFCLFQHHDSRMDQDRLWGMTPFDQGFWDMAGAGLGALCDPGPEAARQLAQTANYPWNKIYRTGFLREHGIGCSETLVHNDIELHWRSFLNARRILASDRIGVVHVVKPGGGRLTNRRGPERFAVFAILEKIAQEIEQGPDRGWRLPFFLFTTGLLDWICGTLQPALRESFTRQARAFLRTHLSGDLRRDIARARPEAYARVMGAPPTGAP